MAQTVPIPTQSSVVDQRFLLEPLRGARHPESYLDRFPSEVYNKAEDSHLVRFMYTLLGPAGVGSIKNGLLQARLKLEAHGLELFDLEKFYGNPFAFGRILEEIYDHDVTGLLTPKEWEEVRAKDERYRSRAIDFLNGARGGNTPTGLRLVARSGLGHECEIIENYRYLFDQHSDDPLGLPYYGKTSSTEEFVVVPRREVSKTEVQVISFSATPVSGNFLLSYKGQWTAPIAWNANYFAIQSALQALGTIGEGNVQVTGGPASAPFEVTFRGALANQDVSEITVLGSLSTASGTVTVSVDTRHSGRESVDEIVRISDREQHNLQDALDRIRPVPTIPTVNLTAGTTSRQRWQSVTPSSEYVEARTFITGPDKVPPPAPKTPFWIEPRVEKEAPRLRGSVGAYSHYHKIAKIRAYTDQAIADVDYLADHDRLAQYRSEHVGQFSSAQRGAFPFLRDFTTNNLVFKADYAIHETPKPPYVTGSNSRRPIFGHHYASTYFIQQRKNAKNIWASLERVAGSEYLEIDLGSPQAVNVLILEISRKPIDIEVSYDLIGDAPARKFASIYAVHNDLPDTIVPTYEANPWQPLKFNFQNLKGEIPFTQFLRIRMTRQGEDFLYDAATQTQNPWSIEVRNVRVGRALEVDLPRKYNDIRDYWFY